MTCEGLQQGEKAAANLLAGDPGHVIKCGICDKKCIFISFKTGEGQKATLPNGCGKEVQQLNSFSRESQKLNL